MEPERKIEKLLRMYAKHRRAKAGDAFKLHPATRRLLQGEVARRKPKADDDETSLSLWELFRTNWAVLAGFVLIIFFCASFLMPALSKAKNKARSVEAMSDLKQIGMAAQIAAANNNGRLPATLDGLTNALGSSLTLTDVISGQRFVYVAGDEILDNLQTNAVLAYSPGNQKNHAVLFADGSVREVRRDAFSALTNRNSSVLTVAAATAAQTQKKLPEAKPSASPATRLPASAGGGFGSAQTSPGLAAGVGGASAAHHGVLFQTTLATDSDRSKAGNSQFTEEDLKKSQAPPVLASFELQPDGNRLFIVDRDGSIYEGTLQSSETAVAVRRQLGIANESSPPMQTYEFHVAGTNRTLKQSVVFAGHISSAASTTTNTLSTKAGLPLSITGTVTLADTNRMNVIALPAIR